MANRKYSAFDSEKAMQWLRRKSPDQPHWWWVYTLLAIVVVVRIALSLWPSEKPSLITDQPQAYRVTSDPDDLLRQQFLEEANRLAPQSQTGEQRPEVVLEPLKPGHLRVAAAQISSQFGKIDRNRRKMEAYIRRAAQIGAKVIVFPEAALPGYADFDHWTLWAKDPEVASKESDTAYFIAVEEVGEDKDGAEIRFFSELAGQLHIYIAFPYIEKDGMLYYSSVALISDEGKVLCNYRKHKLWMVADTFWASAGAAEPEVVQTPLGRIVVLAGYDMNTAFEKLAEEKTDLILHSAAFFGDNLQKWVEVRYHDLVKKSHAAVVLANWGKTFVPDWAGFGLSRIYDKNGRLMAGQGEDTGEFLVVADLTLQEAEEIPSENNNNEPEETTTPAPELKPDNSTKPEQKPTQISTGTESASL